ncbi:hypothetical protein TNCV_3236451 [Trichonephila clavipes]|nr:hypothetical protein TNCV_3236451 [Trichonephila clavipes]
MVLKATANDMRQLAICHDEFCGPRSGLCRSGGISNNNRRTKKFLIETKSITSRPSDILGQHQATLVYSDSPETVGAWLGGFNASTIQSGPDTKRLRPFSRIEKLLEI